SAEGYTPRATKLIDEAREELGTVQEVALALSENLPQPKAQPRKRGRRRRKKKTPGQPDSAEAKAEGGTASNGEAKPKRRRRSKMSEEIGCRAPVCEHGMCS